jgi:hypothetical protein
LIKPGFHITANEAQGKGLEACNAVDEIDQNGIGADPHKDGGPYFPSPDINGLMHGAEQDRTVTAGDQHK